MSRLFSQLVGFRSESEEWCTPPELLAELRHEFGPFELDPAATAENAVAPAFYTSDDDGLVHVWAPRRTFVNPPYGRGIGRWAEKSAREATLGALVVGLFPARTDTGWWHRYVMPASEVRFLRGRLSFRRTGDGRRSEPAPFPSAVVVWRPVAGS